MTRDERTVDALLVGAARAGSRDAFERLARRWDRRLGAHAFRLLGEREAAREATQSAWLEIARGLSALREPEAFPAWAYRIVSRRAAQLIRGRQSDRALAQGLAHEVLVESQVDVPNEGIASGSLSAAIQALPPAQRAAIALHHFEGLSVAETAVALDVPVGTVKTRLMHARLKLRAALQGEDHDPS